MIEPVAETAKDCTAPGIFNYVRRLILFNAKNYEMPKFRPNTDSGREKWDPSHWLKMDTWDFCMMVHINQSEWALDYTSVIMIITWTA